MALDIILIAFLIIFAIIAFFVIDLIRTIRKTIHSVEVIMERFRLEQEFIHNIIFRSKSAIESIDDTAKNIENVIEFLEHMKHKWADKKKSTSEEEHNAD